MTVLAKMLELVACDAAEHPWIDYSLESNAVPTMNALTHDLISLRQSCSAAIVPSQCLSMLFSKMPNRRFVSCSTSVYVAYRSRTSASAIRFATGMYSATNVEKEEKVVSHHSWISALSLLMCAGLC